MLYLFAIINLVLTSLSGLAFINIYRHGSGIGWLELIVMAISLILLLVTNIAIIWVNIQRGKEISSLVKKNNLLNQKLTEMQAANNREEKQERA